MRNLRRRPPSEKAAELKAIREANAHKKAETPPTVAPVASEAVVATGTVTTAKKSVDEAVAQRKHGEKVVDMTEDEVDAEWARLNEETPADNIEVPDPMKIIYRTTTRRVIGTTLVGAIFGPT